MAFNRDENHKQTLPLFCNQIHPQKTLSYPYENASATFRNAWRRPVLINSQTVIRTNTVFRNISEIKASFLTKKFFFWNSQSLWL